MNHAVTTVRGHTFSITGPDAPGEARRLAQAANFQADTDRMNALNAAHLRMWKGMQAAQTSLDVDGALHTDERSEPDKQPDCPGPLVAAGAIVAGVAIVASFIAGFSYQFFWG